MSDSFYQWARRAQDDPYDYDGVTLGEVRLTGTLLWALLAVAACVLLYGVARLALGLTVWTGFAETSVREAPKWMHSPVSSNNIHSVAGMINLVPAMEGQQIVIDYDLQGADFRRRGTSPAARIVVTCLCPSTQWSTFEIREAGRGQFIMPVKGSNLYTVDVYQAPQSDGGASIGQFYWGVRQAQ